MQISIITVCYNSAKTIRRTFESVLNQTFTDYEYIVVDGNSKDGTLDIIKEYEPKFNGRMRWISEPDNGIYDAMNKGIRMAQGEIIGIINSDDYYEFDALQNIAAYSDRKADVYYGMCRQLDEQGEITVIRSNHIRLKNRGMLHPACFVSRDAYDKFGLFDLQYKIAADYELLLRFFEAGAGFVPVDSILANFSSGGISDVTPYYELYKIRLQYGIISRPKYWLCIIMEFVRKKLLKR
ncbi:MAG: glycosyltransferase [Lentisphaeria bacterium]|nr:glycosyltransferase [Lentisphaeria bacterium]